MTQRLLQFLVLMLLCADQVSAQVPLIQGGVAPRHGYTNSNIYSAPYKSQHRYGYGGDRYAAPIWAKPYWARPYTGWTAYRPWLYYGPYGSFQRARFGFGTLPPGFAWRGYAPLYGPRGYGLPYYGPSPYGPLVAAPGYYRTPEIGLNATWNLGLPVYFPVQPQPSAFSSQTPDESQIGPQIPLPYEVEANCNCTTPVQEYLFGQPELRRIYSPADRRW